MSTLVFNANTPTGGQTIASTTIPINTNFASLNSAFNAPVGGVTGGGTFCSYSLQATTTNFTLKPVNPIGVLYTTASTSGNPELAYINNVNSVGAGPYTGAQLTGGGITAAAWVLGNGNVISASFNVSSISFAAGGYTINFTRPFSSGNYASLITLDIDGQAGNATGVLITSRTASQIVFTVRNQAGGTPQFPFSAVFFGYLT
jgi:hypothetical protein